MEGQEPFVVKSHDIHLDSEYAQWLADVKTRYHQAQIKAAVKVNSEQLLFNWQLGRDLVIRRAEEKWGKGVVEQVSLDLQAEFPDTRGFSVRNLWNMKKWYSFYASSADRVLLFSDELFSSESSEKMHQLGAELQEEILHQVGAELTEEENPHQSGGETEFPAVFGFVPWRHHVEIITKCKTVEEALFYIRKTIEDGYMIIVMGC